MPDPVSSISLNLGGIQDVNVQDNMQKLQDNANAQPVTPQTMQAGEIFVTDNQTGIKISHTLGSVPLDVLITRLIAPSAAKLTLNYKNFTPTEISMDVTGLAAGETLSARLFFGTLPNVVTVGTVKRGDNETQSFRSKP